MSNLNELEYINGNILANVYMTDLILRIDREVEKYSPKLIFQVWNPKQIKRFW